MDHAPKEVHNPYLLALLESWESSVRQTAPRHMDIHFLALPRPHRSPIPGTRVQCQTE